MASLFPLGVVPQLPGQALMDRLGIVPVAFGVDRRYGRYNPAMQKRHQLPVVFALLVSLVMPVGFALAADEKKESYSCKVEPYTVGEVQHTLTMEEMISEQTVTVDGMKQPTQKTKRVIEREKLRRVLAVKDGFVTKCEISYPKHTETKGEGAAAVKAVHSTSGHTYIVERSDGVCKVTYTDGTQPSAEETTYVAEHVGNDLGKADPMEAFASGRTFVVGQSIAAPEEILKAMGKKNGLLLDAMTMTFLRFEEAGGKKLAVLHVKIGVNTQKDGLNEKVTMEGDMKIEAATGHEVSSDAIINMEITGASPDGSRLFEMTQKGKMRTEPVAKNAAKK